ncbi:zinc-binding dehydrogenase [Streptomyces sp. NPDC002346]
MKTLAIHDFGGPENLTLTDVELPDPGPGEVLVSINACALNHIDVDIMRGVSRLPVKLPFVPGIEVIGTIKQVGPGVTDWRVGERVAPRVQRNCGTCRLCLTARQDLCDKLEWVSLATSGGYAEELVCHADQLIRVPDNLTDEAAAAVQVAFGTAWHMLFTRGGLKPGETVLINAVGSGIGAAAIQLARWAGATVIGTAGSDAKLERARAHGMSAGVNYTENPEFGARVKHLTDGGVDLVFEHVGGQIFTSSLDSLRKGGRLVTCGAHSQEVVPFDIIPLFRGEFEVRGSFAFVQTEVEKVFALAAKGVVEPAVDSVYSLAEGARAVERMESREAFGKIVIMP